MAGEKAKVPNCVQCGGAVEWRAPGFSITLVCGHCGAVLDVSHPEVQSLIQSQKNTRQQPLIPLGARGKVHGETYEMIGFMERADGTGVYKWREYLLFNPYIGYRWLVEADGHWNYVISTKQKPQVGNGSANYLGKNFRLFLTGEAQVLYVLGEFYWRVKVGDRTSVQDFIAPPEILSRERDASEEVWSVGEYVEPEVLQAAFQLKSIPLRVGVAPNQPSPHDGKYRRVFWTAVVLTMLLLLVQLGTNRSGADRPIFRAEVSAATIRQAPKTPLAMVPIQAGTEDYLIRTTVSGTAPGPAYIDVIWKDRGTGQVFRTMQSMFVGPVGTAIPTFVQPLSYMPDGDYDLTVEAATGILPSDANFSIELIPQRDQWSNFFGAALLLWLYPLWLKFRRWSFDTTRWMQSDFAED